MDIENQTDRQQKSNRQTDLQMNKGHGNGQKENTGEDLKQE